MIDPAEDFANILSAEDQMGDVAKRRQDESEKLNEKLKGAFDLLYNPLFVLTTHRQNTSPSSKRPVPPVHVQQPLRPLKHTSSRSMLSKLLNETL